MIATKDIFLVTIETDEMTPDGTHKQYKVLIEAFFDFAEETSEAFIRRFPLGEMQSIVKCNYTEYFLREGNKHPEDKYYEVKWTAVMFDEKKQTEQKTACKTLVQAESIEEALYRFRNEMRSTVLDYSIVAVVETSIYDVILYKSHK